MKEAMQKYRPGPISSGVLKIKYIQKDKPILYYYIGLLVLPFLLTILASN